MFSLICQAKRPQRDQNDFLLFLDLRLNTVSFESIARLGSANSTIVVAIFDSELTLD